ncbi:MAG: LamG-like jellyroll fold domain-containing protein, partial [Mobilitalea sp.]
LYVNGELIGEGPVASDTFVDGKAYVGINCWDIKFKGLFDDIKVYDTALTAEEVKTTMNEAAGTSTSTSATPKTGVASMALLFGLGAATLGTGSVVLKKKSK